MTAPIFLDTNGTRDDVVHRLLALFAGLGSWRDPRAWLDLAVPQVLAAEKLVAQTTDANLQNQLFVLLGTEAKLPVVDYNDVTGKALRGVDPFTVYKRPFQELWSALADGHTFDEGLSMAQARLTDILETDLQLAATHTVQAGTKGLVRVAYRRVPKNGACALCLIASTQYYRAGTLMPLHPGCRCTTRQVLTNEESHLADPDLLERIHEAVAKTFGPEFVDRSGKGYNQYRDLVAVRQHGELGPVLTRRMDAFEGPRN